MDFSLSEERKMLQETVARFFENNYKDINKRSKYLEMNDGFSRDFWKESANLGVISGLVSPTFGGLGGSGEDISIIFELIGKSLCIEPFLSSGLLSSIVLSSIENPKTELIEPATDKKITLECKEGDIIIFPAFMIHRAPINKSKKPNQQGLFSVSKTD